MNDMPTLRDCIIQSQSAGRMINAISPIYNQSYVGLWLQEAMGREYDALWSVMNMLSAQLFPETATWGIGLWEQRYHLDQDERLPLSKRRRAIKEKIVSRGPFTPARITALIKAVLGMDSYVLENTAAHTFTIFINTTTASEHVVRNVLDELKPAHMSYEIRYAATIPMALHVGALMAVGKKITIRQVN